jgi:D-ribose pyranose/furanose isomerase RbsD
MSPESIEKMETFSMVLELWDQISPSVQEFMGIVKIPLAPITNAIKTTDEEIYSLNFLADQFCMYPMTVCDGFLPIYSPKKGQNIAHLKITLAIGSPVQVNRLVQRDMEVERRRAAELEIILIRDVEILKEKELKVVRKIKKEKKRQLEAEAKQRDQDAKNAENDMMQDLLGGNKGSMSPNKGVLNMLR